MKSHRHIIAFFVAYSSVYLIYNSFVSTIRQEPTIKKLFPISEVSEVDFIGQDSVESKDVRQYVVEPSFDEVLVSLINDYLQDKIRGAILESEAAEHSARMMAMKAATDNATDLIFNLTLLRNKVRQTAITNELLDITTAQLSSEGL
jgi:F-type H+-transporting ATPase subunit gamma